MTNYTPKTEMAANSETAICKALERLFCAGSYRQIGQQHTEMTTESSNIGRNRSGIKHPPLKKKIHKPVGHL